MSKATMYSIGVGLASALVVVALYHRGSLKDLPGFKVATT